MTRDEIKKAMEWESFDYPQIEIAITRIEKIAAEAVKREREACATVCRERAMKCEHEAQEASANGEQDESVSLRATAWQLTVCAAKIEARGRA